MSDNTATMKNTLVLSLLTDTTEPNETLPDGEELTGEDLRDPALDLVDDVDEDDWEDGSHYDNRSDGIYAD